MGNSLWICEHCRCSNFPDDAICLNCNKSNLDKEKKYLARLALKNILLETQSDEKHLKLNERASQTSATLMPLPPSLTQTGLKRRSSSLDTFVDDEFPPVKQSLFMNGSRVKRSNLIHSNGFKQVKRWLRPQEVLVTNEDSFLPVCLFSDPSPKDVIQGELGTCWFLSALALLAEKPFLLLNCMVTQSYNPAGSHQVRLCRRGEWVVVKIDDYLPCDRQNQLVFSYGRKRQFWVPFMEKALAKLYGSYEAVARGACAEGLQTLTGEPCEVLYLQLEIPKSDVNGVTHPIGFHESSPYVIWQKILFSRKLGYLMTTLCYNENLKQEAFDKVGLLNRHIYSILDARELDNDGTTVQLIRLRNPWGHKEWKGDWSNGWAKWPEHIKNQLSVYLNNDGCFWISFQDVLKYFYDITICKVRADWTESRQSSYFYDYSYGAEVYMITVQQPGLHQFEIELFATGRKNKIFDRNADPDIDLCLVLCKVQDPVNLTGLTCVAFEHSVEYYITLSATVSAGTYMVFATSIKAISSLASEKLFDKENSNGTGVPGASMSESASPTSQQQQQQTQQSQQQQPSHLNHQNYYTYNVIFHGQTTFILNRRVLTADIISEVFYAVALTSNRIKYDLNGAVRSFIIAGSCTHGILIENLSRTFHVKVELDTSSSKNLESTRSSSLTQDILEPGTRQLIAFLTPSNYRNGYVIGYKLDTQICQYYVNSNYPAIPKCFLGLHAIRKF